MIAGVFGRPKGLASRVASIAAVSALFILISGPGVPAQAIAGQSITSASSKAGTSPSVVCPNGQCFTDVAPGSTFFDFINHLYLDNIVTGYPCGGTGEPCDSDHRPYYRPTNNVTRGQMSKFVDNGRKNISDAIGLSLNLSNALNVTGDSIITGAVTIGRSLYISTTAGYAVDAETRSGGEAVIGECLQPSNSCYGVMGLAPSGDIGGYFQGGEGVYAQGDDATTPGAYIVSDGSTNYGAEVRSQYYRGEYVNSVTPSSYSLYVDQANNGVTDLYVNSGAEIAGDLIVDGSKTGYVVDLMQNVGDTPLEPGDVVVIVGSSAPVIGEIPVVTVRKTDKPYDTGVAGVVDEMMYVPDPATRAAYLAQEQAIKDAMDRQAKAISVAEAQGTKPDLSNIPIPEARINDDTGNLHAQPDAASSAPGAYLNVVTLGSYKAVKVDASFGPIHAGDLLTTSPHSGYAMKAEEDKITFGSVIGKALAGLDTGTGTIPVMVTLK